MPADVSQFLARMQQAQARVLAAAVRAVDVYGEMVIGNAQQLTPVDTGALQASATTLPAQIDGTLVSKTVGFNTDYAAAVHERLDQNHKIGQAKFLETAMRELEPRFAPFVADKVRQALG